MLLVSLIAWVLIAVLLIAAWGAWLGVVLSGKRPGCVAYFWHQWRPMSEDTRKSLGVDRHLRPEDTNGYVFMECAHCGTPAIQRVPHFAAKNDKTNVPKPKSVGP